MPAEESDCTPITATNRIGRFSFVGLAGFICDGGVLTLLVQFFGWSPYPARVLSFLLAVTCTWILNRRFAFHDRAANGQSTASQYVHYLSAQTAGSLANMVVFALLVWQWPHLLSMVIAPLALGAIAGVVLNYLLLDRWVFKRRPAGPSVDSGGR